MRRDDDPAFRLVVVCDEADLHFEFLSGEEDLAESMYEYFKKCVYDNGYHS